MKEIKKENKEVRSAVIEMPHGKLLSRPINVLYPLEVEVDINPRNESLMVEKPVQEIKQDEVIAREQGVWRNVERDQNSQVSLLWKAYY